MVVSAIDHLPTWYVPRALPFICLPVFLVLNPVPRFALSQLFAEAIRSILQRQVSYDPTKTSVDRIQFILRMSGGQ